MAKPKAVAFYETDEFKAEKAKWDKVLADEGRDDIFDEPDADETIIRPQIIKTNKTQYLGGGEYFDFCQKILREYQFKREVDRVIFDLHTNGRSLREIEEHLVKNAMRRLKKSAIEQVIKRTKEIFLKGQS